MPLLPRKPTAEERLDALTTARFNEVNDRGRWTRSYRGNLVRKYDGYTLTIFWVAGGGYKWVRSIPGGEGTFSQERFDSEEEAIESIATYFSQD